MVGDDFLVPLFYRETWQGNKPHVNVLSLGDPFWLEPRWYLADDTCVCLCLSLSVCLCLRMIPVRMARGSFDRSSLPVCLCLCPSVCVSLLENVRVYLNADDSWQLWRLTPAHPWLSYRASLKISGIRAIWLCHFLSCMSRSSACWQNRTPPDKSTWASIKIRASSFQLPWILSGIKTQWRGIKQTVNLYNQIFEK